MLISTDDLLSRLDSIEKMRETEGGVSSEDRDNSQYTLVYLRDVIKVINDMAVKVKTND